VTIAGLVLAGGKSLRFAEGAKEEALLLGRPLLDHVIERAAPQVEILAISRVQAGKPTDHGLPVVADIHADCGPLGGLHAGLMWASSLPTTADRLAAFACDTPLILETLVRRLDEAMRRSGANAVIPSFGGKAHLALGLWSVKLAPLAGQRLQDGLYSLHGFAEQAGAQVLDFRDAGEAAFFNVNTVEDLAALKAMLADA
jgi:molybdopterin-guanine dinucleotide biosynthesis protein A